MNLTHLQSLAGISNNTPIIKENLNHWQILAGLTPELLQEAREEQIAKTQGHKLISAYQQKEQNPTITNPLELLQFISNNTIPEYIQWTTNQYIKDPTFTLQDLPKLKELLTLYKPLFNRKKIQDLSNFNIKSLEQTVSELSGNNTSISFNPDMILFYEAMLKSEKIKNGYFKYKSNNLCIYSPHNIEGTRELRRSNPDKIKLCTTFLDTDIHFNIYQQFGIQNYILTHNNLFLLFISHSPQKPNELKDYKNQPVTTQYLFNTFPVVLKVLKKDILKSYSLDFILESGVISTMTDNQIVHLVQQVDQTDINTIMSAIPNNKLTLTLADTFHNSIPHDSLYFEIMSFFPEYIQTHFNVNKQSSNTLPDGTIEHRLNGHLHNTNGPAVIKPDGTIQYYTHGEKHNTNGPADIRPDGTKAWYQFDKLHNTNGPAVIFPNGDKFWYQFGKKHRTDGPAVELQNSTPEFFLNNKKLPKDKFNQAINNPAIRELFGYNITPD